MNVSYARGGVCWCGSDMYPFYKRLHNRNYLVMYYEDGV